MVYTNDCLIFAPDNSIMDSLISSLSTVYKLEDQSDIHDYRITYGEGFWS